MSRLSLGRSRGHLSKQSPFLGPGGDGRSPRFLQPDPQGAEPEFWTLLHWPEGPGGQGPCRMTGIYWWLCHHLDLSGALPGGVGWDLEEEVQGGPSVHMVSHIAS